jgi:hypothetical protein
LDSTLQEENDRAFVYIPAYSAVSNEDVAQFLSHYNLGKLVKATELKGGLSNSNYRLETTAGTYLLKICDEKNIDELKVWRFILNSSDCETADANGGAGRVARREVPSVFPDRAEAAGRVHFGRSREAGSRFEAAAGQGEAHRAVRLAAWCQPCETDSSSYARNRQGQRMFSSGP